MQWVIVKRERGRDRPEKRGKVGQEDLGKQTRNRQTVSDPLRRREREMAQRAIQRRRDRVEDRNRRTAGHVENSKRHDRTWLCQKQSCDAGLPRPGIRYCKTKSTGPVWLR